jgi:hypothetical protein
MIAIKHNRRIKALGTAIFVNYSRNILRFPTCVINVSGVDKEGDIWFLITKPYDHICDFDKKFPAELQFYNKHYNYYITVTGVATITSSEWNERTYLSPLISECGDRQTAVSFRIVTRKYHYSKKISKTRFTERISNFITNFLLTNPIHIPG